MLELFVLHAPHVDDSGNIVWFIIKSRLKPFHGILDLPLLLVHEAHIDHCIRVRTVLLKCLVAEGKGIVHLLLGLTLVVFLVQSLSVVCQPHVTIVLPAGIWLKFGCFLVMENALQELFVNEC